MSIRGIRQPIVAGVVGRVGGGTGAPTVMPFSTLASQLVSTSNTPLASSSNVTAETNRAKAAEATLSASIAAETARAEAAEAGLLSGVGVANGSNAAAGMVGEYLSAAQATNYALSSGTVLNLVTLVLSAGDWDVAANAGFIASGTTTITYALAGLGLASVTVPANAGAGGLAIAYPPGAAATGSIPAMAVGPIRVNVSTATSIYLVVQSSFASGGLTATGFIGARRAR